MREPKEDGKTRMSLPTGSPWRRTVSWLGLAVRTVTVVAGENPEPPRPPNTSWGVGPWSTPSVRP
jgi:hypothetical protein